MPKIVKKKIDKKLSIGQVAKELEVQAHVIRFWETKFNQIQPEIGCGDRRYYLSKDVSVLKKIKHHLYDEGYTIAGLQKLFSGKKNTLAKDAQNDNSQPQNNLNDDKLKKIKDLILGIENKLSLLEN